MSNFLGSKSGPIKSSSPDNKSSKSTSGPGGTSRFSSLNVHVSPMMSEGPAFNDKFSNIKLTKSKIIEPSDDAIALGESLSQYRNVTGIFENEPLIILSSEFIPIFDDIERVSKSLELKENASLVVARNACLALSLDEVIEQISKNSTELQIFIADRSRLVKIISSMSNLYDLLRVKDFTSISQKESTKFTFLIDHFGAKSVSNYTGSKIWLQTLLETKRICQSYSQNLLTSAQPALSTALVEDTRAIVGLNEDVPTRSTLWINYIDKNPLKIDDIFMTDSDNDLHKKSRLIKERFDKIYIDREASEAKGIGKASTKILDGLAGTCRDITIVSTILTKELNYSRVILDLNDKLINDYGFDAQTDDPQTIFDYLIGTFTKSSWDVPVNPAGKGLSLSSFAHELIDMPDGRKSAVLTFERSFSDESNMTPGAEYFIERSLSTLDGENFNVSGVRALKRKIQNALQTIDILQRIVNGDSGVQTGRKNSAGNNKSTKGSVTFNAGSSSGSDKTPGSSSTGGKFTAIEIGSRSGIDSGLGKTSTKKAVMSTAQGSSPTNEGLIGADRGFSPHQLVQNIYSQFEFLKTIYYELYQSVKKDSKTTYSDTQASRSERLAAAMLKSCVNPNSYMSDKSSMLKTYLFMLAVSNLSQDADEDTKRAIETKIMSEVLKLTFFLPSKSPIENVDYSDEHFDTTILNSLIETQVWKTVVRIVSGYLEMPVLNKTGQTSYSRLDTMTLAMVYFDLVLRIISSMTPDDFFGNSVAVAVS